MAMYLPEPATLAILIGPIKHNVLEAFGQLQTRVGALQLTDRERESLRIDRLDALLDVLAPPG
jgi:hypothetical protein